MDHYDDDYDESRRSRWLKLGGGVLAGVVLLAAGFGIGRLSVPASGSGQQQHANVSGPGGPGPTRVENGVPVGYAHTQVGAVTAATNFLVVKNGALLAQPEKYRQAISGMAAPEAKSRLLGNAEGDSLAWQNAIGLISYAQQGRSYVLRTVPFAYHVDRYEGVSARLSIWAETFAAVDGVRAPIASWSTATYTVKWVSDDWKLTDISASVGPSPEVLDSPQQTSQLPPQIKQFTSYRYDLAT